MITSKRMMLDVMSKCDNADTLNRIEKFQVFCNVCDNMLKEGRMTKATHKRFTEIWWQLGKWHRTASLTHSMPYNKFIDRETPHATDQLRHHRWLLPEAFIAEACEKKGMKVTIKRFVKRVTFRANGMRSYSTVLATDAEYEWQQRIAKGATVTGFNTEKMPSSEYMPCFCWCCTFFLSSSSLFLFFHEPRSTAKRLHRKHHRWYGS